MLYGLDVGAHTAVPPHYTSSHTNTDAGYRLLGWAGKPGQWSGDQGTAHWAVIV